MRNASFAHVCRGHESDSAQVNRVNSVNRSVPESSAKPGRQVDDFARPGKAAFGVSETHLFGEGVANARGTREARS